MEHNTEMSFGDSLRQATKKYYTQHVVNIEELKETLLSAAACGKSTHVIDLQCHPHEARPIITEHVKSFAKNEELQFEEERCDDQRDNYHYIRLAW